MIIKLFLIGLFKQDKKKFLVKKLNQNKEYNKNIVINLKFIKLIIFIFKTDYSFKYKYKTFFNFNLFTKICENKLKLGKLNTNIVYTKFNSKNFFSPIKTSVNNYNCKLIKNEFLNNFLFLNLKNITTNGSFRKNYIEFYNTQKPLKYFYFKFSYKMQNQQIVFTLKNRFSFDTSLFLYNICRKILNKNELMYTTKIIDKNKITHKYYINNPIFKNFFFKKNKNKKPVLNINFFIKYLIFDKEIGKNLYSDHKLNIYFLSNKYFLANHNLLSLKNYSWENKNFFEKINKKHLRLNNYYPVIFTNKKVYSIFFKKFKYNFNLDYVMFNNKFILNFLETFFKKKISITISNNYFNKFDNYYLRGLMNNYKNLRPIFFKNYSVLDFIEVIWYSFYLKDLNILSSWVSKFMEGLTFKNHKRFVMFFQNFINKNSGLFTDVLKIKGFFFDIRGKVGVTGSSKKRHFFVKFGCLGKSSKINKVDFNQNLVRSYSGVMGVTYIICY